MSLYYQFVATFTIGLFLGIGITWVKNKKMYNRGYVDGRASK